MDNYLKNPWWVIALGIAICFGLAGVGLAFNFIIHGLAGSVIQGSLISTIVLYVTEASAIAVTGTIAIRVVNQVVEKAKKDPYNWVLPVLAIFSGFIIDSCKELLSDSIGKTEKGFFSGFEKNIYGGVAGLLFLAGGILWRWKMAGWKAVVAKGMAVFFFLLPAGGLYEIYRVNHPDKSAWDEFTAHFSLDAGLLGGGFLLLCLAVVLISRLADGE
jgi:hypothetical protein